MKPSSTSPFARSSSSSARARISTSVGGAGWWWSSFDTLGGLEVALPEIDVDRLVRRRGVAPQLARIEADAVGRLRPAAIGMRRDVRQREDTVDPHHGAPLA